MITLALDASTYVGGVAVLRDDVVLSRVSIHMRDPQHERLMPAVASSLEQAGISIGDVGRIVCGAGPGSFTSLRIAGSIAKGLAAGAAKPLFAVPSMALVVAAAPANVGRYLVAVDALRGEFYVALYHVSSTGDIIEVEPQRIVAAEGVAPLAVELEARLVSPSQLPDAMVAAPDPAGVRRLSQWLEAAGPVDIERWEPQYGRLAEAQVKWESAHGRPLPTG